MATTMSMMVPSERPILPTALVGARASEEEEAEAAETPSSRETGTGEVVLPEAEAAARRDDGSDPMTPNRGRADGERRQQPPATGVPRFRLSEVAMGPPGLASAQYLLPGGEGEDGGRHGGVPIFSRQSFRSPQPLGAAGANVWWTSGSISRAATNVTINNLLREQAASAAAATTHLQAENTCLKSDKKELTDRLVDARAENMLLRGHKRQLQVELQEARDEIKRLRRQEMDRYAQ